MSNPGIDSILAAAAKPTHCKCGHNKAAHSEVGYSNFIENRPCAKASCGCMIFRPAIKAYPETDKDDLYDLLVSVASENTVWRDRLKAHESCGEKFAQLSKNYESMHSSHDGAITQLQQLSEVDQQTIAAQARKLAVFEQLLNMAVDGGRIGSEMFDAMNRGLQAEDELNTRAALTFLSGDIPEGAKRLLDALFEQSEDDDDVVDAHICESDNCDDPSHDTEYVTPRDLQVNMSASSEAQKLKDASEEAFGGFKVQPHTESYLRSQAEFYKTKADEAAATDRMRPGYSERSGG